MRYLLITYYKKPNGHIDEAVEVSKNLRARDIQMANVILDFKKLRVEKCSMDGTVVPKDFNRIVDYYMQHYENIIRRLFAENGYEVVRQQDSDHADPDSDQQTDQLQDPAVAQDSTTSNTAQAAA